MNTTMNVKSMKAISIISSILLAVPGIALEPVAEGDDIS